jgi:sensor domain CHASE-containing protein
MYIKKVFRLLGIVIALLTLVTMIVSTSALSSSFAQVEQKFTAKMTDKEEAVVFIHLN